MIFLSLPLQIFIRLVSVVVGFVWSTRGKCLWMSTVVECSGLSIVVSAKAPLFSAIPFLRPYFVPEMHSYSGSYSLSSNMDIVYMYN